MQNYLANKQLIKFINYSKEPKSVTEAFTYKYSRFTGFTAN